MEAGYRASGAPAKRVRRGIGIALAAILLLGSAAIAQEPEGGYPTGTSEAPSYSTIPGIDTQAEPTPTPQAEDADAPPCDGTQLGCADQCLTPTGSWRAFRSCLQGICGIDKQSCTEYLIVKRRDLLNSVRQ